MAPSRRAATVLRMVDDSANTRLAKPRANGGNGRAVTIIVSVVAAAASGAVAGAAVVRGGADIAGKVAGNGDVVAIIAALFVIAGFLWTGMRQIDARIDRLGAQLGDRMTSLETRVGRIEGILMSRVGADPTPPRS